jgi:hypothetical protein
MFYPTVRFGLLASWEVAPSGAATGAEARALNVALLVPEMPLSVLPFSLRQGLGIRHEPAAGDTWQGRPAPTWRGVPCRLGTAWARLINQLPSPHPIDLPVQVLLPERDPPGPAPGNVLLGSLFLTHYGLRVALNYASFRYTVEPGTARRLDSSVPAGHVEMA